MSTKVPGKTAPTSPESVDAQPVSRPAEVEGSASVASSPYDHPIEHRLTFAAYNVLRENVAEAVKQARNLFLVYVTLNAYGLLTVATMKDVEFFGEGKGIKLPGIDLEVAPSFYLPGIALLSIFIFVYFQMHMQYVWTLQKDAERESVHHVTEPSFIPPTPRFSYPWLAFSKTGAGHWDSFGALALDVIEWGFSPILLAACWVRAARSSGSFSLDGVFLWASAGLPWAPAFAGLFGIAVIVLPFWSASYARLRGQRILLKARIVTAVIAALLTLVVTKSRLISPLRLQHLHIGAASLGFAELSGAKLTGAHMRGAHLRSADLSKADLTAADIREANLGSVDLSNGVLNSARLSNTDLNNARLDRASGSNAMLDGANLYGGSLRYARFRSANFKGASLRASDLTQADLAGADLTGADLTDASLVGTTLKGARYDDTTRFPSGFDRASAGLRVAVTKPGPID
jgi:uncharacterized protein YjbI with pentapeptide repeats